MCMKQIFLLSVLLLLAVNIPAAVLWSQDFTSGTTGFYTTSGMTRNAGSTYSCSLGNYVYYTSSSFAYIETNTINVGQGKGINLSFSSRRKNSTAGDIQVYYLVTGACSWDRLNPNNNGWVLWGTITPNTSAGSATGCTSQSLSLESHVCGGQNIAVLLYFPNASSTNWITIDDLVINDLGPTSVSVPVISGATTYTENFTTNKWYGPVTTGFNYATTGVTVPYHSYRSSSTAYTYLWNNGCNGTANHSGVWADYFAAFYTGFEFCNSSGSSQIITKELNTSLCASPEIKFAYMAKYPCTAGNYDNTWDESYLLYAPKLYTSTGQGYTWTQQSVNYYFPDGLWHFATYSVPSAANIKIRLSRGGTCTSPIEGVDNIKVFCRDCSISSLNGGTITGESSPSTNTDYVYTITPTAGATYYKWMIRAIDRTPPEVIEAACPNGSDPCIVSGQGTTSVTINFGSNATENYRVMCIPYDANPGTLAAPSDACYAKISLFPTTTLPVEWGYFRLNESNNNVLLEWQTLTETNNDRFEIQKSTDEENFTTIASLPGAGNSNSPQYYAYTDEKLQAGVTYYRIRQIDFDGKSEYSRVLSIISENPESGIAVSTFFNNTIEIYSDLPILYPVQIELTDIQGRRIFISESFTLSSGSIIEIPVPAIPDGIYLMRISGIGVDKKMRIVKNSSVD